MCGDSYYEVRGGAVDSVWPEDSACSQAGLVGKQTWVQQKEFCNDRSKGLPYQVVLAPLFQDGTYRKW